MAAHKYKRGVAAYSVVCINVYREKVIFYKGLTEAFRNADKRITGRTK